MIGEDGANGYVFCVIYPDENVLWCFLVARICGSFLLCSVLMVCITFIGFIEHSPLLYFFQCSFTISLLSKKCFATALTVSPGHDANWWFLTAVIHVGFVGNSAAAVLILFLACIHCGWLHWVEVAWVETWLVVSR